MITINNPNRSFDIYNAGDLLHRGFSPSRLQANSLHNSGQFLYNGDAFYHLNKTCSSILPPLINALEVYSLIRMENLPLTPGMVRSVIDVDIARIWQIYHVCGKIRIIIMQFIQLMNSTSLKS